LETSKSEQGPASGCSRGNPSSLGVLLRNQHWEDRAKGKDSAQRKKCTGESKGINLTVLEFLDFYISKYVGFWFFFTAPFLLCI